MMLTEMVRFDGVLLEVPLIGGYHMEFICDSLGEYPSYCGPGSGVGNAIVPEDFYGTRCSVACHIHDVMRALASKTEEEFSQSNEVFFYNLCRIIFAKEQDDSDRTAALHQAVLYYHAVQNWGKIGFFKHKEKGQCR